MTCKILPILARATGFSLNFARKGTLLPALKGINPYKNVDKYILVESSQKCTVDLFYEQFDSLFNKTNKYLLRNVKILIILVLYWNLCLTKKVTI